jgi:hypothetical protein
MNIFLIILGTLSLLVSNFFLSESSFGQTENENSVTKLDSNILQKPRIFDLGIDKSKIFSEKDFLERAEEVAESEKSIPFSTINLTIEDPTVNTKIKVKSTNNSQIDGSIIDNRTGSEIPTGIQSIEGTGLNIYQTSEVKPVYSNSLVNEPSVASNGKGFVFYTGNWYAMRSIDGGKNWENVDYTFDGKWTELVKNRQGQMVELARNFNCCDDRVVYDTNRDLFIWYRQGSDGASVAKTISIAVSKDTYKWAVYYINGSTINKDKFSGNEFDYPSLVLGENYVYVTTNVFQPSGALAGAMILRISLDDLNNNAPAKFSYFYEPGRYTFTPATGDGTNTKLYWGTHINNDKMRIYEWSETESSDNVKSKIISIPAWAPISKGDAKCGMRTGIFEDRPINWCGRIDSKIRGGWMTNDMIGFLWTADSSSKTDPSEELKYFTWPYVNSATFDVSSGIENASYLGRSYIWSPDYAWLYAAASPNKEGKVGLVAFYGNGIDVPPSLAFGITDDLTKPVSWKMIQLKNSTHFPLGKYNPTSKGLQYSWGDYLTVTPNNQFPNAWDVAGYVLLNGTSDEYVKPYYFKIQYMDPEN